MGYRCGGLCSLIQVLAVVMMVVNPYRGLFVHWVLEMQWRAEATYEAWVGSKDREGFPRVLCGSQ